MNIKNKLLHLWNDNICEETNRKALRAFYKANHLWHTNNILLQFFAMKMHAKNIKKYNCQIYPQAQIGSNLYIPHCLGIVVGNTAIIGNNCKIFPNVVIGSSQNARMPKIGRRHAIIGDNCILGANSSIIGAIHIGDNVIIGAGAVVTKDVPSNSIVLGINLIKERK